MAMLEVHDLVTEFPTRKGVVRAVNGVTFDLEQGEILAVVGESGSGKSVTSLSIMGLLQKPGHVAGGSITFDGKDLLSLSESEMEQVRGGNISMIFQEPMTSLNPVYRVGDQIVEAIQAHEQVDKKDAWARAVEMLRLVGIPSPEERAHDYPHQMSGGMRQRVMIAMALACQPQILIADEPTTALDVTIQAQILDLIRDLNQSMNTSVVFITHDLGVVSELCDTVMVMYNGRMVEKASAEDIFEEPLHPYTQGLLSAIPCITKERAPLSTIEGMVPNPTEYIEGCRFCPRCPKATERCRQQEPPVFEHGARQVRCWLCETETAKAASETETMGGDGNGR